MRTAEVGLSRKAQDVWLMGRHGLPRSREIWGWRWAPGDGVSVKKFSFVFPCPPSSPNIAVFRIIFLFWPATLCGLWDLSFLTRDWTRQWKRWIPTIKLPGKSPHNLFWVLGPVKHSLIAHTYMKSQTKPKEIGEYSWTYRTQKSFLRRNHKRKDRTHLM